MYVYRVEHMGRHRYFKTRGTNLQIYVDDILSTMTSESVIICVVPITAEMKYDDIPT